MTMAPIPDTYAVLDIVFVIGITSQTSSMENYSMPVLCTFSCKFAIDTFRCVTNQYLEYMSVCMFVCRRWNG